MGINGPALLAGVEGFNRGQDRQEAKKMRQYGMDRQASQDARQAKLDAQTDEDRARALQQDQQYGEPERKARLKALQDNEAERGKMEFLNTAYMSKDPAKVDEAYTMFDDGYTSKTTQVGDDLYEFQTPKGKVQATWDQLFFGNPDGAGIGLFHLVNPGGAFKRAQEQATAKQKQEAELADEKRQHDYRMTEIGASAANQRSNAMLSQGEPFRGDDGNMYILRPDGSVQPVMNNGQPMKAPQSGMGLPRAGTGSMAANPFGNSAKSQERWTRANMLAAGDKSGQLQKILDENPYAVANMVEQFDRAGADRTLKLKLSRDMVKQAASGIGETMTAEEITKRAEALMASIEAIAGPEPQQPGASTGGQAESMAVPEVGAVVDGYRYKGGDPNSQDSWEPVQ